MKRENIEDITPDEFEHTFSTDIFGLLRSNLSRLVRGVATHLMHRHNRLLVISVVACQGARVQDVPGIPLVRRNHPGRTLPNDSEPSFLQGSFDVTEYCQRARIRLCGVFPLLHVALQGFRDGLAVFHPDRSRDLIEVLMRAIADNGSWQARD